jgi:hypothetical protein
VSAEFADISDHRRANARYPLTDFLLSVFAMFSLKEPSLLSFDERTKVESRNLKSIYQIEAIPSDTQMRTALDPVSPTPLRQVFRALFDTAQDAGVIREYHFWRDHALGAVDGVEHFASTKIHCEHCSTRTLRDGATEYFHSGLGAVLVNPAHEEVLPLDFEPILKQDGAKKNDCERNAAKRLCASLHEQYPDLEIILVEDDTLDLGDEFAVDELENLPPSPRRLAYQSQALAKPARALQGEVFSAPWKLSIGKWLNSTTFSSADFLNRELLAKRAQRPNTSRLKRSGEKFVTA